jgi:hypothetical protein
MTDGCQTVGVIVLASKTQEIGHPSWQPLGVVLEYAFHAVSGMEKLLRV